ncbi:MAG: SWIM zinc finger family protein [Clostridia bacterium]|nr:SWIM zinc finger family protein [Clostridia bacterium]
MKLLRSEVEFIKTMIPEGEKLLNNLAVKELSRQLFHLYFETETYNSKQKQLRKLLRYIWWLAKKVELADEIGKTEELIIEEDIEITEEVKRKLEKLPVELKEFLRDKEWRDMFSPLMLYRAEKLSHTGIKFVYKTLENTYYAQVQGEQTYHVEVSENLHDYMNCTAYCDCPYAKREDYCKHMASVLFYVERNRDVIPNEIDMTAEMEVHFYESRIDGNGRLTNSNGFWITKEQIKRLKALLPPRQYMDLMEEFEEEWDGEEPFLENLGNLTYEYEIGEMAGRWVRKASLSDLYDEICLQNEVADRNPEEIVEEEIKATYQKIIRAFRDEKLDFQETVEAEKNITDNYDYLYVGVSPKGQYGCNYWYIDEEKQTQANTYVWVNMGRRNTEQIVYVDSVRYCNADDVPYPIEKTKRVLRQATEEETEEADVFWDE